MRNLKYSREAGKRTSSFGRCLASVEGLGFTQLEVGDRLEPSQSCRDIGGGFDQCNVYPLHVTFWRERSQSWAYHRNPLWSVSSGFTLERVMMVDFLHAVGLGVCVIFATYAVLVTFRLNIVIKGDLFLGFRWTFLLSERGLGLSHLSAQRNCIRWPVARRLSSSHSMEWNIRCRKLLWEAIV